MYTNNHNGSLQEPRQCTPQGPSACAETLRCRWSHCQPLGEGMKENHLLPPDSHKQDRSSLHSRAVLKGLQMMHLMVSENCP